jgi:hypothetical protein
VWQRCPDLIERIAVDHQAGAGFRFRATELDFERPLVAVQKEALSVIGPGAMAAGKTVEQGAHMEPCRPADGRVRTVHGGDVFLVVECVVTH